MSSSRMGLLPTLLLGVSLGGVGCTSPATQVVLNIEVDEDLSDVDALRVQVVEPSSGDPYTSPAIPAILVLTPEDGDSTRTYEVNIDGLSAGRSVAAARFRSGYVECETRYATVRLSRRCVTRADCSFELRDPQALSLSPGDIPLDPAMDGGFDPDVSPDGGEDSGVDTGPDVTMSPDTTMDTLAPPDVMMDAVPDVMMDAVPDVMMDAAPDVMMDAVPDVMMDAAPDVTMDGTVDADTGVLSECLPMPRSSTDCDPMAMEGSGMGTGSDPIRICSAAQLERIGRRADKHFVLTQDIVGGSFTQIADDFEGVLDGQGFALYNFSMEGVEKAGIFKKLAKGAIVRNLVIRDFSISGDKSAAVLADDAKGMGEERVLIENVRIYNGQVSALSGEAAGLVVDLDRADVRDISLSEVSITAAQDAHGEQVGGIVAKAKNSALTRVIVQDLSISSVKENVGGIVGVGEALVITEAVVRRVQVAGDQVVGGILGIAHMNPSTVERSYVAESTLIGDDRVGGLAGKLDVLLTLRSSYTSVTFAEEPGEAAVADTGPGCKFDYLVCDGADDLNGTAVHIVGPRGSSSGEGSPHDSVTDWFMTPEWSYQPGILELSFEATACVGLP